MFQCSSGDGVSNSFLFLIVSISPFLACLLHGGHLFRTAPNPHHFAPQFYVIQKLIHMPIVLRIVGTFSLVNENTYIHKIVIKKGNYIFQPFFLRTSGQRKCVLVNRWAYRHVSTSTCKV